MKTTPAAALLAIPMAAMLAACSPEAPPAEVIRPVRTVELRYEATSQTNRYAGTVRARHEVAEAFRVGGKIVHRKVEVGQVVRAGDVLGVIEDTDYKLAAEAAQQAASAAASHARQSESDHHRLAALKSDGSVSESAEEQARTAAQTARANATAEAKKLDLARNRLNYTVLRASRGGVVTDVRFEAGQLVAEGQPVVQIAGDGEPEIVVDVPEDQVSTFRKAQFKATLASAPGEAFDVTLRELSPQAAAQTRTYRARLKPVSPRQLPLGATASLLAERKTGQSDFAAIPAAAVTQSNGQPAVWVVRSSKDGVAGSVELAPVKVGGYANEQVFIAGLPVGTKVVAAGVQKMSPGLRVVLATTSEANPQVVLR